MLIKGQETCICSECLLYCYIYESCMYHVHLFICISFPCQYYPVLLAESINTLRLKFFKNENREGSDSISRLALLCGFLCESEAQNNIRNGCKVKNK